MENQVEFMPDVNEIKKRRELEDEIRERHGFGEYPTMVWVRVRTLNRERKEGIFIPNDKTEKVGDIWVSYPKDYLEISYEENTEPDSIPLGIKALHYGNFKIELMKEPDSEKTPYEFTVYPNFPLFATREKMDKINEDFYQEDKKWNELHNL